jgi:deoxyhypusine synthase
MAKHSDRKPSAAGPKGAQKAAAEERERSGGGAKHDAPDKSKYLRGPRIEPTAISGTETVADLIDNAFLAYNAARLREACQLFTRKMLEPDVTVGMTLTGALTPAGLGMAALIPLIEGGYVDWIISTGANLYHDTHFGLGLAMHRGNPQESDVVLRDEGVVRIFFDYDVLSRRMRAVIQGPEFQRAMSSAEFHNLCGKYVRERERARHRTEVAPLAAYNAGVPIYTSSPGDSSISMNVPRCARRKQVRSARISTSTSGVDRAQAKRSGGKSAVLICGGSEELHAADRAADSGGARHRRKGHDYSCRSPTRARHAASGATPAGKLGKIDPTGCPTPWSATWVRPCVAAAHLVREGAPCAACLCSTIAGTP